ncbi:MAG: CoA transferase [Verrucomicrobia bacterium]|nr:CoA transferase [Verrucomicrobiota bacterium]
MKDGALADIRVLDVSQMMAGPLCGMRLGDLGAEVIKVEPPERGEWVRQHGFANAEIGGETTALLGLNRNKKSITINLKEREGREILYDLVRKSDIFIQNFRVGTADRLGIGYAQLSEINPRLIYCSISGYGETGPYQLRPGQDLVIQGYSGSMFSVGRESDGPVPGALFAADAAAAYQTTIGALAALLARQRTNKGQKIEVNLLASLMDVQIQEITTHLNLGVIPQRTNEPLAHAWVNAPYGAYQTADGWMTIAMAPVHVLGEVLDNHRLREMKSWSDGVTCRDEVFRIVSDILPQKTTGEWLAIFDRHNIWAGPVYTYADLSQDTHVNETGMIAEVEHSQIGRLRMPNVPIRLSDTPAAVRTAPPRLGEHTDMVLQELLGYEQDRLAALRRNGVI